MEDDDIPYKTIDTLLLPNSSSSTVLKETLFAESARVSLSMPKGSSSKIYTKYLITRTGEQDNYTYELDDEEYNNGAYGRIICGGGNS